MQLHVASKVQNDFKTLQMFTCPKMTASEQSCTLWCIFNVQLIPGQHIKSLWAIVLLRQLPYREDFECPSFNLMLRLGSEQSTQNHGTPRRESRQKVRGKTAGLILFIPQQQHALGSSAIVKVSEQARAAPKDIPPGSHKVPTRFQGSRQVPTRFPRFLQGSQSSQASHNFVPQGSPKVPTALLQRSYEVPTILFHKVPTTLFHKVPTTLPHKVPPRFARFPQLCSKVPTRFPQLSSTTFPQLCPTRFPQGSPKLPKVPTSLLQGSHSFAPRLPQGSRSFAPMFPQASHNFAARFPEASRNFAHFASRFPQKKGSHSFAPRLPQISHSFTPRFPQGFHNFAPQVSQGSHKIAPRFPQLRCQAPPKVPPQGSHNVASQDSNKAPKVPTPLLQGCPKVPTALLQGSRKVPTTLLQGSQKLPTTLPMLLPRFLQGSHNFFAK